MQGSKLEPRLPSRSSRTQSPGDTVVDAGDGGARPGRYEYAIEEYQDVSSDYFEYMQPCAVEFVVDQMTECYVKLADWAGLVQWRKSLKEYRMQFASGRLQRYFQA